MHNTLQLSSIFSHKHVVLPVIHVKSQQQALRNAQIAYEAGADGVFLINHTINAEGLLAIQNAVANVYPDWWVGVNCLGLSPGDVFARISPRIAGVWVDNAMILENQRNQSEAQAVLNARQQSGWNGLYFGGVAFKYQRHVDDLCAAAKTARDFMDVVTTSGPGTGKPAHVEKIRIMKSSLEDFPLAIASGITPDNVADYLPYSDCYLVATGISRSFDDLDPILTQRLIKLVRQYDREVG